VEVTSLKKYSSLLLVVVLLSMVIGVAANVTLTANPWIAYILWGVSLISFVSWLYHGWSDFTGMFKRRGYKYGASSGISVILGFTIIVGLAFLSGKDRFNLTWDVTKGGLNTLSDQSLKIIDQLKEGDSAIELVGFFTDQMKKQEFERIISLYKSSGAPIAAEYVDPQEDPTRAISEKITASETVLLKYQDQEARLMQFSEEKITNALLKLIKTKEKKIYFLTGHGEKNIDAAEVEGYSLIRDELISERYKVEKLSLLEVGKVPDDANLLVIAGPTYDFREQEISLLEDALNNGLPLFALVDAMTVLPKLAAMLETYGLKINNDFVVLKPDDPRVQLIGQNNAILTNFDEASPATRDFAARSGVAMLVSNARSVTLVTDNANNMNPISLASSADINIAITDVKDASDLKNIDESRIKLDEFTVIAASTGMVGGEKLAKVKSDSDKDTSDAPKSASELRIAVAGSSYFASNNGAQRMENIDMFLNLVGYLLQDEDYISIRAKDTEASELNLVSAGSQFSLMFLSFIYPFVFLAFGVGHWFRRRRA
jgi:ABC-type uncharacterized transport system involved in gliding motility auxiliary subunit